VDPADGKPMDEEWPSGRCRLTCPGLVGPRRV
jgi:hypothetical protein